MKGNKRGPSARLVGLSFCLSSSYSFSFSKPHQAKLKGKGERRQTKETDQEMSWPQPIKDISTRRWANMSAACRPGPGLYHPQLPSFLLGSCQRSHSSLSLRDRWVVRTRAAGGLS